MHAAKIFQTFVVFTAMANAGVNIGIFSPTFPDMEHVTSSTTVQMSTTLTWIGVASALGAVLSGPLFDRFNGHGLLAVALLAQGVAIGLAPWCRALIGYQIMSATACIFNFAIMCGSLSMASALWANSPHLIDPVVQGTHLAHGLGAGLAPLIVAPFQRQTGANVTVTSVAPSTFFSATNQNSELSSTARSPSVAARYQPIQMAYVVVAIIDILVAVLCAFAYFRCNDGDAYVPPDVASESVSRCSQNPTVSVDSANSDLIVVGSGINGSSDDDDSSGSESNTLTQTTHQRPPVGIGRSIRATAYVSSRRRCRRSQPSPTAGGDPEASDRSHTQMDAVTAFQPHRISAPFGCNCRIVCTLVIILFFFAINGGRDALLTGLLYTYAVTFAGWTKRGATLLVTSYHVTRTVIQAVVAVASRWVTPLKLMIANVCFLLVSSIFLVVTVGLKGPAYLVIGVMLTAFATSNIHPTTITLARIKFKPFQVNGVIMGLFVSSIALGQCVLSPVAAILMTGTGPQSVPNILLLLAVVGTLAFLAWMIFDKFLDRTASRPIPINGDDGITERTSLMACSDASSGVHRIY